MKVRYIFRSVAILSLFVIGCSTHGMVGYPIRDGEQITVDQLIESFDDFNIFYAGYAVNNPSGLLFDPKKDDKNLTPSDKWVKIDARDVAYEVAGWIKIQEYAGSYPVLYGLYGTGGQFYGYMYSVWYNQTSTKAVDENTLFVFDLPAPPHYYGPGEYFTPGIGLSF